jgi:glycosyltransferase involved in cell wall biosynthesis
MPLKSSPQVSVIIPCYNHGQFIDETINSVLAQTFDNFEIIVVNDGSTDPFTVKHLRQLDFPKTRVVHTDNQGLSSARNNGIREARGEYILPLDADDRIGPTYLEQAVRLLDENPDLGIVYCRAMLFGDVNTEWLLPEFSVRQMLLDNIIFCSALFRCQDWRQVGGYDTDFRCGWEDYDFWLALLERGRRVYRIPEILFYYRVSSDSMVRARPRRHKLETFSRIFRKHQGLYARHIEVWVDKLLDAGEQYHQAVLLPPGGRAEDHARWARKVDTSTRSLKFQFSGQEQGREFIFHPADSYVALRLAAVILADESGCEKHISFTHNADFEQNHILCFCSTSPVVHFSLPKLTEADEQKKYLVIELEYSAFGQDCIPILNNLLKKKETIMLDDPISPLRPETWFRTNMTRLKRLLISLRYVLRNPHNVRHYRTLKKSGLFDADFYLHNDRNLDPLLIDPLIHYLEYGWHEQRNPNPLFEAAWYSQFYNLNADQEPLLHYIEQAGNDPNPLFFTTYYAEQCGDNTVEGQDLLGHYLTQGWREGKNPNPLFDTAWYLARNPEIAELGQNPFFHYYHTGSREQRNPMPFFSMRYYCERNPLLLREWLFPVLHFLEHGEDEEQTPAPCFDPEFYRETYGLEGLTHVELFLHYAKEGRRKKYKPTALFDAEFYGAAYPESLKGCFHPLEHYQEQGVFAGNYPCQAVAGLAHKPVISILTPVYNTDEALLRRCILYVLYQAYPHWQLCLVDDGSSAEHIRPLLEEYAARDKRIKIHLLRENQGISLATNQAAELASGEYLAFLDHDDELTQDALYRIAEAINEFAPDALYSDEELIDWKGFRRSRFYKSDYNPELLLCHNYITHFFVTRRSLFHKAGGLSPDCTGAQDYDLVLKITEQTDKVHHIRRSLYRWRATETSTSINHDNKDYADAAGLKALRAAVQRRNLQAEVSSGQWKYYYALKRQVQETCQVSVLTLLEDNLVQVDFVQVEEWLEKLIKGTSYQEIDFHVLLRKMMPAPSLSEKMADRVNFHKIAENETETAAFNRIAAKASGEHLVFLRQGVLPQEENWIEILLGYSQTQDCGVVGGRVAGSDGEVDNLAVPDLTDQSCAAFRSLLIEGSVHLNGIHCPQNVLAPSFAFCMLKRRLFDKMKGFDIENFSNCLYDIDFCLRLRELGVEHVFTPLCNAVATMPNRKCTSSSEAWLAEKTIFHNKWRALLVHNPYYNENRALLELGVSRREWLRWIAET